MNGGSDPYKHNYLLKECNENFQIHICKIALTDLEFLMRSVKICKESSFLDNLRTINQEGSLSSSLSLCIYIYIYIYIYIQLIFKYSEIHGKYFTIFSLITTLSTDVIKSLQSKGILLSDVI